MRGPVYYEDIKMPFDAVMLVNEGSGKGRLAFSYKGKEFCYFPVPHLNPGDTFTVAKIEGSLGVTVQDQ